METTEECAPGENEKLSKYWNAVKECPSDFTSWTCLLQIIDQENILEKGREIYAEFFKWYPYCYGYWKKYADLEKKNGNLELTEKVYSAGVKAIPLSIDLWIHYLNFVSQYVKEEPNGAEKIRALFEKAIETAGLEFRSDKLWDAYIDWEKSQGNLENVLTLYDRLLSTPTQQYIKNFTKFKDWINSIEPSEVLSTEDYVKLVGEVESIPPGVTQTDKVDADMIQTTAPPGEEATNPPGDSTDHNNLDGSNGNPNPDDSSQEIAEGTSDGNSKEKEETAELKAVREKIIAIRDEVYKQTEEEIKKRWHFEDGIKRPYFHVKPLERIQLRNWRDYLEFEIKEGDQKRICILFERCLIACALYEEFWQKYVNYLESMADDHSVTQIHDVYERACTIHLTKKPDIILSWAAFEESQQNIGLAREILESLENAMPGLIMVTLRRVGLERRIGSTEKAIEILRKVMEETDSVDEKSFLAIKCAKYYNKLLHDKDSARKLLHEAVENDKANKKLYLNLLDLETDNNEIAEDRLQELCDLVEGRSELSMEFKQGFLQRRLEILEDFGTSIDSIVKAYDTYQKQFKIKPGAIVPKKRTNGSSNEATIPKVSKTDESQTSASAATNNVYANHGYAPQDHTAVMSPANSYAYPAMPNQWNAYAAAQTAGSYYGWYNPYGTYPSQPAQ
ncbi:pre-mRNA-processing factor 39-like [Rhopilema esculentum]|uniref:pre-mRNA-processing factor 39-like n=1 Tax=Rhopilema esculentum TaxID=499914 RepID=UPI0031D91568